jgi:hypothetical protein
MYWTSPFGKERKMGEKELKKIGQLWLPVDRVDN